jgi:hypothetical protein
MIVLPLARAAVSMGNVRTVSWSFGRIWVPGDGTVLCKTKLCDDIAEALAVGRTDTGMDIWRGLEERHEMSNGCCDSDG